MCCESQTWTSKHETKEWKSNKHQWGFFPLIQLAGDQSVCPFFFFFLAAFSQAMHLFSSLKYLIAASCWVDVPHWGPQVCLSHLLGVTFSHSSWQVMVVLCKASCSCSSISNRWVSVGGEKNGALRGVVGARQGLMKGSALYLMQDRQMCLPLPSACAKRTRTIMQHTVLSASLLLSAAPLTDCQSQHKHKHFWWKGIIST